MSTHTPGPWKATPTRDFMHIDGPETSGGSIATVWSVSGCAGENATLIAAAPETTHAPARTVTIPVCYEADLGPDLADVAALDSISVDDVIRLHTSATYLVYFLGFSPGFAYLGGLDEKLRTPRLATPRKHVVAGSVGIAGEQTGVYPIDSAGGWRLLGRTPLRMFDPIADPPSRLQPGDHVRFTAISRSEFEHTENV